MNDDKKIDTSLLKSISENAVIAGLTRNRSPEELIKTVLRSIFGCLLLSVEKPDRSLTEQDLERVATFGRVPLPALKAAIVGGQLYRRSGSLYTPTDKGSEIIQQLSDESIYNVVKEVIE